MCGARARAHTHTHTRASSGTVLGVGYGDLVASGAPVIAAAMLEKPVPTCAAAALHGITDPLRNPASRLMVGHVPPVSDAAAVVVAPLARGCGFADVPDSSYGWEPQARGGATDVGGAALPQPPLPPVEAVAHGGGDGGGGGGGGGGDWLQPAAPEADLDADVRSVDSADTDAAGGGGGGGGDDEPEEPEDDRNDEERDEDLIRALFEEA